MGEEVLLLLPQLRLPQLRLLQQLILHKLILQKQLIHLQVAVQVQVEKENKLQLLKLLWHLKQLILWRLLKHR
jgi:hypothetical protein